MDECLPEPVELRRPVAVVPAEALMEELPQVLVLSGVL
jgi:hypothetical protein